MAKKKKKTAARKITKKTTRPVKRTAAKAAARKAPAKKAATPKKTPKKKTARGEFGEGNYKASRRFRADQETFVKTNKAKIPGLGKAAEAALDGPEGDSLRAAEAKAAGHAAGKG